MIRIEILTKTQAKKAGANVVQAERAKLEKLVEEKSAGWLANAAARTAGFRTKGRYEEDSTIWSEIKEVYMKLQANKCAYCEQKLEAANIVHDVEHFRPKSSVKTWLTAARKKSLKIDFADEKSDQGYFLLPYDLFNYVTSCKQCNSSLKSNCFPVAGARNFNGEVIGDLNVSEKPFLPYPLGHIDPDGPEDLISFEGAIPVVNPNLNDAHKKLRAFVTIKFFNLDVSRESLIKQRFRVIKDIYETVRAINDDDDAAFIAAKKKDLKRYLSGKEEHANCARCFFKLCMSDIVAAKEIWVLANKYLNAHPDQ